MAEPEGVIIDAAHFATIRIRSIWNRASRDDGPSLATLRGRLELFVAALVPGAAGIGVAEPPAPLSLLARWARGTPRHLRGTDPQASTDGVLIRLPAELPASAGGDRVGLYQLLALEQATRAQRGSPQALPHDPLVRDLYMLAEACAVDQHLALALPRLRSRLEAARTAALSTRPVGPRREQESEVERLTCLLLSADPAWPPTEVPAFIAPEQSVAWARAEAARIRSMPGPYRGMAPVSVWGNAAPAADAASAGVAAEPELPSAMARTHQMRRRPRVRAPGDNEDDDRPGTWLVRADDPQQSVEDPMGLQRPHDTDAMPQPEDLADALADLPEARLVRSPGQAREVLASADPLLTALKPLAHMRGVGIAYPEWDCTLGRYRPNGAIVQGGQGEGDGSAWAERVLRLHAPLVRRVRRHFERLGARRRNVPRQRDGSALDIDACVEAFADQHAGAPQDGAFYVDERRNRRDAAVMILVDVSASTDGWVEGTRRIIDVEKEGLLIVCEALAALGDPHAVYAFRSQGPGRVDVVPVKGFHETPGLIVRGRIGALEPGGYTRAGAAIRHATAQLARQRTSHALLILLSDGRPNDVDIYDGKYGIEDTRQAIAEARAQGVHPFCLTVDREAPSYSPRIFGRDYAMLRHPGQLATVLVDVVQRMLR